MKDWTHEDGELGFDAVKAERDQAHIELENARYRLSMAESNNPDSVLSKHNAMLMAVENADRYAAELSAVQARLAEATELLERWHNRRWGVPLDNGTSAFLASTPTPPPAPEPDHRVTMALEAVDRWKSEPRQHCHRCNKRVFQTTPRGWDNVCASCVKPDEQPWDPEQAVGQPPPTRDART